MGIIAQSWTSAPAAIRVSCSDGLPCTLSQPVTLRLLARGIKLPRVLQKSHRKPTFASSLSNANYTGQRIATIISATSERIHQITSKINVYGVAAKNRASFVSPNGPISRRSEVGSPGKASDQKGDCLMIKLYPDTFWF
ncbi:hypothetical protein ElyMa_002748400 [Elysia marginata]|uniref:Uncharacterized protein n=1 Tax=Elysia marginata TaxID=1093978 RepID=A0AAV4HKH6_9GAST|nr:hypothetical protein ElyMa_002748400 [Elysia marginata]